ncbi:MAG: ActS/PrrB/RegB family redox-sensitive histidine kinase [Alphaproteobacteria bacterium]|jgi:two-component system sensor histidine kinase RegB|nr:ActS/PrrB/RegB family redox-sensitive histidine kinase [Alphaproteobacteria bacterium]MBP9867923.1 ActS/PrrB/RegB family redox-sensitive histidine kinase [Alphaproteobacteria bacterium]
MTDQLTDHILTTKNEFQIRGQSLITARWIALLGQSVATLVAYYALAIDLPILACMTCITLSGLINNYAVIRDKHRSLPPRRATSYLSFDLLQLTTMLFLTGGMGNPFYVLLLAPTFIGATLLPKAHTIFLVLLALAATLFLSQFSLPLDWPSILKNSPNLQQIGQSVALGVALVFASFYAWKISVENRAMQKASYAAKTTLLRQQQLQALGAQAAAAAHELGSPLGTIAIIAKELEHAFGPNHPHAGDVALLLSQTERCRSILRSFGDSLRQDPTYMATPLPIDQLLKNIGDNFSQERPQIKLQILVQSDATPPAPLPLVPQSPELLHGLGVYVQNAIQFAKTTVTIRLIRDESSSLRIVIHDDGAGFAPQILSRLGEPYISTRLESGKNMGLGVFIAQTLLEDTGATLSYDNKLSGGALVTIEWPLDGQGNLLFTLAP